MTIINYERPITVQQRTVSKLIDRVRKQVLDQRVLNFTIGLTNYIL